MYLRTYPHAHMHTRTLTLPRSPPQYLILNLTPAYTHEHTCMHGHSGQVFPYAVAAQWEERISQEFRSQASREEELGLPVAPFMQGLHSEGVRAKLQVRACSTCG